MKIEKLYPVCKDYIWGGTRLKDEYGKQTDKTPCAESWELSFHKDGLTCLESGETLAKTATQAELGTNVQDFPFFPVLIKFIDAKQNLSVQVHPSDNYALRYENSFGKTVVLTHLNNSINHFALHKPKITRATNNINV